MKLSKNERLQLQDLTNTPEYHELKDRIEILEAKKSIIETKAMIDVLNERLTSLDFIANHMIVR